MRIRKYILILSILIIIFGACKDKGIDQRENIILTSILPIKLITSEIIGDLYEVQCIIDKPTDPHSFEIKPSEARRIEDAFVFIINGADLEFWASDFIINRNAKKKHTVDTSKNIPRDMLIYSHQHCHDHGHSHDHESPNPHFWLDPMIAVYQAEKIAEKLSAIDPENASIYKSNFKNFKNRINNMHEEILNTFKPLENRSFIEYHSAFIYFAKRYDLILYDVIIHTPDSQPSPRQLNSLIKDYNDGKFYGLFGEVQSRNLELETISREIKRDIVILDPMGFSINPEVYDDIILHNTEKFLKGLE